MNKLKCKPVMLPRPFKEQQFSHEIHGLFKNRDGVISFLDDDEDIMKSVQWFAAIPQFLYLVSDREIKEGDWHIWLNQLHRATKITVQQGQAKNPVEATTDPSLGLPFIPDSFVQQWVEKQGKIEWVWVEIKQKYMHGIADCGDPDFDDYIPTKKEVIILPTKDSFTREEALQMLLDFAENVDWLEDHDWRDKTVNWFNNKH